MSARRGWPVVLGALAGLGLSACAGAGSDPDATLPPREVELTMTGEMTFEPATVQVRLGETVVFRVRNLDDVSHEAYVGTEVEQRLHETIHSGYLPADADQARTTHMGYGAHVAPFGTSEFVVKFEEDLGYVIGCHYPGPYAAGMRAVIEIDE